MDRADCQTLVYESKCAMRRDLARDWASIALIHT